MRKSNTWYIRKTRSNSYVVIATYSWYTSILDKFSYLCVPGLIKVFRQLYFVAVTIMKNKLSKSDYKIFLTKKNNDC